MSSTAMDPDFAPLIKHPRAVLRDARQVRAAMTAARQEAQQLPPEAEIDVRDSYVPFHERKDEQIPLRVYRPRAALGALPVLLYLHGGGFFCGDIRSEEQQCIQYALGARCVVVCVDYRLAPEEPFPAALADSYRVLQHLWENSDELQVLRDRIAVGGSSAGANLAAALTLLARDHQGPKIWFQMLLIPALDDRLETPSARQFTEVPDFARAEAETMWRWYLGAAGEQVSAYAAPARAENLSDLPRAYVLCAGLDPLRDDGLQYAQRLTDAGVEVELHLVPSIPHGFASISSAAISKRLLREQVEVLRGAFR